jgi:predicted nucleic acid-binding protein
LIVFVDTSALYAVLDADDDRNPSARATWVDLLENRYVLQTDSYVLLETLPLLQSRLGIPAVNRFTTDILPVLNVFWVDEGVHRSAHHALLVSARRRLSLNTAFCFDPHFAEQGFRVLPDQRLRG